MDKTHFNAFTRALTGSLRDGTTRRGLTRLISGLALGSLLGLADADAGKKKKKKKKKKKRKNQPPPPPSPPPPPCCEEMTCPAGYKACSNRRCCRSDMICCGDAVGNCVFDQSNCP